MPDVTEYGHCLHDELVQELLKRLPFVPNRKEASWPSLGSRRLDLFLVCGIQDFMPYVAIDRVVRISSIGVSNEITAPYLPETFDYLAYGDLVCRLENMQEALL
ncbi:hypothetical protein [Candidatus Rariloculus sp.]|uniref:hypothetical protein n=1 Tax=Candidatus Rariloculus sp. TaxID=3101265 RepID=UPI003D0BFFCA